ncbi:MAG: hypothetical protein LBP63_04070, partial [Prevotellaceae bacterium]|nr:hypothetical protein [Prevotellaceae bacterium]
MNNNKPANKISTDRTNAIRTIFVTSLICFNIITLSCAAQEKVTSNNMNMNNDFVTMVSYAVKAPSGHNTQPWKFNIFDYSIEIVPDLTKALPAVDGNHRELFISLGCALENL